MINWIQLLAQEVNERTKDWPATLRQPKPGTDLDWERVSTGK